MRIFSFSEVYGPFPCEIDGCKEFTFECALSDEENNALPEQSGAKAAMHIISKGVGKMICEGCFNLKRLTG